MSVRPVYEVRKLYVQSFALPDYDICLPEPVAIEIHGSDFESGTCLASIPSLKLAGVTGVGAEEAVEILMEQVQADITLLVQVASDLIPGHTLDHWDEEYALQLSRLLPLMKKRAD